MGGQIGSLLLARPEDRELGLIGLMGVGTGSPFARAFPNPERRRLRIGGLMMGTVGRILGLAGGPLMSPVRTSVRRPAEGMGAVRSHELP